MLQTLAIARKELMLLRQRPGTWLVVFIVPFIFIALMQAVFGSSGTPTVSVFAVNEDGGPGGAALMQTLKDAANLHVEELETREEADGRVGKGERMAAVIIPAGYTDSIKTPQGARIDVIVDPARAESANIVIGLLNNALAPTLINAEVSRGVESGVNQILGSLEPTPTPTLAPDAQTTPAADPTQAAGQDGQAQGQLGGQATATAPADGQGTEPGNAQSSSIRVFLTAALNGVVSNQVQEAMDNPQIQLAVEPVAGTVRQPSLLDSMIPGYSLMFLFFLVSNVATTMVEERQTGTLRRLLIAPLGRTQILIGKALPYFLIGMVQLAVVILVSTLLFGLSFGSDLGNVLVALLIIIFASALVVAALGILIAAFARSEGQASGLGTIIILVMAVVSGAMFPTISIPGVKMATPHYWALTGFVNVLSRGQGVEGALGPAGILIILAAIFFTIGAVRFRFEKQ